MPDPDPAALDPVLGTEALRSLGLTACLGASRAVLDIGFGRAELLLDLAAASPTRRFLGVEVSRKRVEKAARRVRRLGLENVKLVNAPAEYVMERVLPPACIAECWINFPDPWPKKRHHRRRLFQRDFLARLAGVLEPRARLHAATDHWELARWIDAALASVPELENLCAPDPWTREPPPRPRTGYEAEWLAEGRDIAYFEYLRR